MVEGTLTGEGAGLLKRFATKRPQGAEQGLVVFSCACLEVHFLPGEALKLPPYSGRPAPGRVSIHFLRAGDLSYFGSAADALSSSK